MAAVGAAGRGWVVYRLVHVGILFGVGRSGLLEPENACMRAGTGVWCWMRVGCEPGAVGQQLGSLGDCNTCRSPLPDAANMPYRVHDVTT